MLSRNGKNYFELKLDNISNCVVPDKNRNEVEIQFHESDTVAKEEDRLVQIRFHFPDAPEEDDDEQETTPAEEFHAAIHKGISKSISDHIIVEFSSEEGTFVTPKGRFGIQVVCFLDT